MLYGLDVSEYQPHMDFHRARAEGFEFCGLRGVGSINNPDVSFHRHYDQARAAGMVVIGAYLFQNPRDSAQVQADTFARHVPKDCPAILDSEFGAHQSGPPALTQHIVNLLRDKGYNVPLVYYPLNQWNHWGRPDLTGMGKALWKPHYPDNRGGYASEIYQRVPSHYWNGHGGLDVAVLQFSQAAHIANSNATDANAFLGTRVELEALIHGGVAADMQGDERHAIFDILKQFSGSDRPGEFPGWENFVNGNHETFVNFIRWIDNNLVQLMAREAGQTQAINDLAATLGADSFDLDALLARVRAATSDALKDAVVDVNVDISRDEPEA